MLAISLSLFLIELPSMVLFFLLAHSQYPILRKCCLKDHRWYLWSLLTQPGPADSLRKKLLGCSWFCFGKNRPCSILLLTDHNSPCSWQSWKVSFQTRQRKTWYLLLFEELILMSWLFSHGTLYQYKKKKDQRISYRLPLLLKFTINICNFEFSSLLVILITFFKE